MGISKLWFHKFFNESIYKRPIHFHSFIRQKSRRTLFAEMDEMHRHGRQANHAFIMMIEFHAFCMIVSLFLNWCRMIWSNRKLEQILYIYLIFQTSNRKQNQFAGIAWTGRILKNRLKFTVDTRDLSKTKLRLLTTIFFQCLFICSIDGSQLTTNRIRLSPRMSCSMESILNIIE